MNGLDATKHFMDLRLIDQFININTPWRATKRWILTNKRSIWGGTEVKLAHSTLPSKPELRVYVKIHSVLLVLTHPELVQSSFKCCRKQLSAQCAFHSDKYHPVSGISSGLRTWLGKEERKKKKTWAAIYGPCTYLSMLKGWWKCFPSGMFSEKQAQLKPVLNLNNSKSLKLIKRKNSSLAAG